MLTCSILCIATEILCMTLDGLLHATAYILIFILLPLALVAGLCSIPLFFLVMLQQMDGFQLTQSPEAVSFVMDMFFPGVMATGG